MGTEIGWLEATYFGAWVLMEVGGWVLPALVVGVMGLGALAIWLARHWWGNAGGYVAALVSFLAICFAAASYGIVQGKQMTRNVVEGKAAVPATCKIKDSAWGASSAAMARAFETLSEKQEVRLILQSGSMMYFTFTNVAISEDFHGQAFVVNTSDVAYCRLFAR